MEQGNSQQKSCDDPLGMLLCGHHKMTTAMTLCMPLWWTQLQVCQVLSVDKKQGINEVLNETSAGHLR